MNNSTSKLPNDMPQRQNYIEVTVAQLKEAVQAQSSFDPKENIQQSELVSSLMDKLLELGWTREDLQQLVQEELKGG